MRLRPICGIVIPCLWIFAFSSAAAGEPRANVWVAYAPGGGFGMSTPQRDGTATVTAGSVRPPIFSARLRSTDNDSLEVDLLTPGGFDSRHVRVRDVRREDFSDRGVREEMLERALMHHRPAVRVRIGADGEPHAPASPQLRRHDACARRLLRAAIEARIAAADNAYRRRAEQERLEKLEEELARTASSRIDNASLLLGFAMLSLPSAADAGELDTLTAQQNWRARQIRVQGRPVRLQLDLLSAARSPAAALCRSLAYSTIAQPSSDTCTIHGTIDRRDGWPIRLVVSREGGAVNGATENQFRWFERVAPLQGFVPPANPCPAEQ